MREHWNLNSQLKLQKEKRKRERERERKRVTTFNYAKYNCIAWLKQVLQLLKPKTI